MAIGKTQPEKGITFVARPRVYPDLRKRTPNQIPAAKPASPKIALPSPPANRSKALQGHPKKTNAPTMAKNPKKKRMMGEEPPLGLNSLKSSAAINAPRTKPMISGRIYWTSAARWSPSAPAISLSMQATQIPMLPGLPHFCKSGAKTPTKTPAETIPQRDAKKFLMVVMDDPPFLKSRFGSLTTRNRKRPGGREKMDREFSTQKDRNKIGTSLFSLSFY